MLLDFLRSVQAKPVAWLSLQALVNKVSSLERPAIWQLVPLDLDLLSEDHVPNLFATTHDVGAPTHHEFVTNDAESEVINGVAMVLTTHDLRCHVTWRARRVLRVLIAQNFRDTHISDTYVACVFHDDVLRLNIAMYHTLQVHVLEPKHHAR